MVEKDAKALIGRFGDGAYYVARDRAHGQRKGATVDAERLYGHWSAVKDRIADLTSKEVGLDTATRYLQDR